MGNYAVGREIGFGFEKETAYNEAWGSPTLDGIYINPAPDFTPNIERIKEVHAHGYPTLQPGDFAQGVKNWTKRISGIIPKELMGWLFLSLFGKVETSAVGDYSLHEFTVGINTPTSLKCLIKSLIKGTTDIEWRLSGAMVRSLEVIWEPNRPIMFSMELIGGRWDKATLGSTITVQVPPGGVNPFWYFNDALGGAILNIAGKATGWNSATFRLESVLADDIEDSYSLDAVQDQRKRLERASSDEAFRCTVTAKRILTDIDEITNFTGNSNVSASGFIGDANELVYFMEMLISRGKIIDLKHTPKGAGIIHEEITIEAEQSGNAQPIQIRYEDRQAEPATQGT